MLQQVARNMNVDGSTAAGYYYSNSLPFVHHCFADGCAQISPLYLPSAGHMHRRLNTDVSSPTSEFGTEMTSLAVEHFRRFPSPSQFCSNDVLASLVPFISQSEVSVAAAALQLASLPRGNDPGTDQKQRDHSKRSPAWDQCYVGQLSAPIPPPRTEVTTVRARPRFTQDQLDAVLYGYVSSDDPAAPPFALSGIRPANGSLSYGIDQILYRDTPSKSKASSQLSTIHVTSRRKNPLAGTVNPSTLDLPEGLEIRRTVRAGTVRYGVYCSRPLIQHATRFGPYRGRVVNPSEIKINSDNSFMWEVFVNGSLSHFVDGRGSSGCWMSYVNCARYPHEQNLVAVQTTPHRAGLTNGNDYGHRSTSHTPKELSMNGGSYETGNDRMAEIFYETCRDVPYGTELLVWYGDCYDQFLGIPVSLKTTLDTIIDKIRPCPDDAVTIPDKPLMLQTCRRPTPPASTSSVTMAPSADVPSKRSWMSPVEVLQAEDRERQRVDGSENGGDGFQCSRCGKVFAYKYYRDKHLKYTRCVDQGDRKFPCHLCSRSFEKRDRLRIHVLHVHEKHRPHKCSVCSKSFSQSSSLNKHMRVHSGERPYKCVYCSKAFTASSILRTHIRQHSGEKPFKCKFCGKAFASHAAHDSHARRTHGAPYPASSTTICRHCGFTFDCARDLKLHSCLKSSTGSVMNAYDDLTRSDGSHSPCALDTRRPDLVLNDDEPIDVVGFDMTHDVILRT